MTEPIAFPLPAGTRRPLQRSIEQALTACPGGLTMRGVMEEAARRELAAGRPRPSQNELLTAVGMLVVSRRVDERSGLLVLCADPGARAA